jgi:hypothetical protein
MGIDGLGPHSERTEGGIRGPEAGTWRRSSRRRAALLTSRYISASPVRQQRAASRRMRDPATPANTRRRRSLRPVPRRAKASTAFGQPSTLPSIRQMT